MAVICIHSTHFPERDFHEESCVHYAGAHDLILLERSLRRRQRQGRSTVRHESSMGVQTPLRILQRTCWRCGQLCVRHRRPTRATVSNPGPGMEPAPVQYEYEV